MIIVPESAVGALISSAECLDAVEGVFASMARRSARNFPVVREAIGHRDALYGFKSGFDRESLALGLKAGGFWPGNARLGLTNHQSSIVLFDAETGRCQAVVGGNLLTALRTAASSALSIRYLARPDARVLGIVGAGHQAAFQLRAALAERSFERVVGWNRDPAKLNRLAAVADEFGLPFEAVPIEQLGPASDVIITITSSFAPILTAAGIRPGTHLACMGTDTRGKQEVETALVAASTPFTDEIAQAIGIGECQHAFGSDLIREEDVVEIGAVVIGAHPGRSSPDEITLFDGTGVGLQDLAVAAAVVRLAQARGVAIEVDF